MDIRNAKMVMKQQQLMNDMNDGNQANQWQTEKIEETSQAK